MKDKAQFEAMVAYSPYHHVRDGTAYPAFWSFLLANAAVIRGGAWAEGT